MKDRTSHVAERAIAPAPSSTRTKVLVGLLLGGYLAVFFLWPLASTAEVPGGSLRRGQLFGPLFLVDELVQRWFEGCSWASLSQRLRILSIAGAVLVVAWAAGALCLGALGVNRWLTRLERPVFALGVGLSVISTATLALGLAGALDSGIFLGIAVVTLIAAGILAVWSRRPSTRTSDTVRPIEACAIETGAIKTGADELEISPYWLLAGVPFVVAILLGALLPPLDFDVREYHLQAPKEFYLAGRITFLPHNVYANMPLGAEMLSLVGMVVAGDWWTGALVGKVLIAMFAPLAALALAAAGQRLAAPAAGWIAAVVYISIPWIALVSTQGLIEGAFAFYLFASLYAVLIWRQQFIAGAPALRLLMLAGFLAGAAVACKYPALLYVVVPLTAGVAHVAFWSHDAKQSPGSGRLKSVLQTSTVFLLFVALACGLWLGKNVALTGNPTYPLLYEVFGGKTRSDEKDRQWSKAHRPASFSPSDAAAQATNVLLGSDWLSPLVVPLAALAGLRVRSRRLAAELALYCGFVLFSWWLLTHRIERFWLPIMPVAALLAGIGSVWTNQRWWKLTLGGFMTVGLVYNFAVITSGVLGDSRYLVDLQTARRDERTISYWHRYLNEHAAEVTGVLLVGDAQPFDLDVPTLYNTVFDDSLLEQIVRGHTPQNVRRALTARKISHIYVDWSEIARYRSPGNYGITEFLKPAVFDRLVKAHVLEAVPSKTDQAGQLFKVLP